ncbi:MAG: hypothetical protein Q4C80_07395 [Bacillota bacterium]|nr:hypothetical protein [Bacillota bacterium]
MIGIIESIISGFVSGIVGRMPNNIILSRRKRNHLITQKLTNIEKDYILKYYDSSLDAFNSGGISIAESKENRNILNRLVDRNILCYYHQEFPKYESYDGNGVVYKLTPEAIKRFNKKHWKNKLLKR